jgi:hypothetical protein
MIGAALALVVGLLGGDPPSTVAVLPLSANDTGLPYEVLPSQSQLHAMTRQLRLGLTDGGIVLVPENRLQKACYDDDCATSVGRAMHVDRVVFGTVTRVISVWWSTDLGVVDVHSGKMLGEMRVDYKGDVISMEHGERDAGQCIARALKHEKLCKVEGSTFR